MMDSNRSDSLGRSARVTSLILLCVFIQSAKAQVFPTWSPTTSMWPTVTAMPTGSAYPTGTWMPTGTPLPTITTFPSTFPPSTPSPTKRPSKAPTKPPTNPPSPSPTTKAPVSASPTIKPTKPPTRSPTRPPINPPTTSPTKAPTIVETDVSLETLSDKTLTSEPTKPPTRSPVASPPTLPAGAKMMPTKGPTLPPVPLSTQAQVNIDLTDSPTESSLSEAQLPLTGEPSSAPSVSFEPTVSSAPSDGPTNLPTQGADEIETIAPVLAPTVNPVPIVLPTTAPVVSPTVAPSLRPVSAPTPSPVAPPTIAPVVAPTGSPTGTPTDVTTASPTLFPTASPTAATTTATPTGSPTGVPSTLAPSTLAPSTETPTTTAPSTESPTTMAPSTQTPTTMAPSTEAPMETEMPTEAPPGTPVDASLRGITIQFVNAGFVVDDQIEMFQNTISEWFDMFYQAVPDGGRRLQDRELVRDMNSQISITNQEVVTTGGVPTNTVTYDHLLKYVALEGAAEPKDYAALPFDDPESTAALGLRLRDFENFDSVRLPLGAPNVPPQIEADGGGGDDGLGIGAIVGIAAGGAFVLAGLAFFGYNQLAGDDDNEEPGGPKPPTHFNISADEDLSTIDEGRKATGEIGSIGGYGDQSVATVDYDYSKAYGGGEASVVSSAGGTMGDATRQTGEVTAGGTALSALGAEATYSEPGTREEVIEIFAPAGKLGVVIDTPDDGAPVVHAVKDSSVIADQIQVGDKLIAVDDDDVRSMTAIKVSKLISKKSANPSRKLTIVRSTLLDDP